MHHSPCYTLISPRRSERVFGPGLHAEAADRVELGEVEVRIGITGSHCGVRPVVALGGELVDAVPVVVASEEVANHQHVGQGLVLPQVLQVGAA